MSGFRTVGGCVCTNDDGSRRRIARGCSDDRRDGADLAAIRATRLGGASGDSLRASTGDAEAILYAWPPWRRYASRAASRISRNRRALDQSETHLRDTELPLGTRRPRSRSGFVVVMPFVVRGRIGSATG